MADWAQHTKLLTYLSLLGDYVYGNKNIYLRFCLLKCLKCLEMWFLSSCLYSAVGLTRVREWSFIRTSYYYHNIVAGRPLQLTSLLLS